MAAPMAMCLVAQKAAHLADHSAGCWAGYLVHLKAGWMDDHWAVLLAPSWAVHWVDWSAEKMVPQPVAHWVDWRAVLRAG